MLMVHAATPEERLRIVTLVLSSTRYPPSQGDVQGIFNFLNVAEIPKC